jgi:hypothetical protein
VGRGELLGRVVLLSDVTTEKELELLMQEVDEVKFRAY